MADTQSNIDKHYLMPSAVIAEKGDMIIDTILGSCIAVCLYDSKLKIGGMNHYMLPFWNGKGLASPKYGNIAIEKLIGKMVSNGASKGNMVAKIFGGANQIMSTLNIGSMNREVAVEELQKAGIKIVAESTGGSQGRKIRFNTSTGDVLMKYFKNQDGESGVIAGDQPANIHKEAM